VFRWNHANDTYSPNDIDDLLQKSERLDEVRTLLGYSIKDLRQDLRRRQEFLGDLVLAKKEKLADIAKEFANFHLERLKNHKT